MYVQEFLDIKQTPDEGIRHFLPRLKGVALHCDFSVDCVCQKKVSYTDSLIKFKLESGLVDSKIKEDILGAGDKSLEDTVKAIEAKEGAQRGGVQGGEQELLQLQRAPQLPQGGGVSEVSLQEQDMVKIWDPGSL